MFAYFYALAYEHYEYSEKRDEFVPVDIRQHTGLVLGEQSKCIEAGIMTKFKI